jgi:hypothetical protein
MVLQPRKYYSSLRKDLNGSSCGFPGGTEENYIILSQDIQCPGPDSNWLPLEHKSKVLPHEPTFSVSHPYEAFITQ